MAYAETTKVPISQTKAEMERLLIKHGATAFGIAQDGQTASVFFRLNDRMIRFRVSVPEGPQRARSHWRALLLVIKAKLEAVATGIVTLEDEFLAQTVMGDGTTVGENIQPQIAENYRVGGAPRLMLGSPR